MYNSDDAIRGDMLRGLERAHLEEMALIERRQRFAAARKHQPAPISHDYDIALEHVDAPRAEFEPITADLYADMEDAALVDLPAVELSK